ncbi:phage holin family protein [Clostridium sp. CF011]|uniref:phage holin family protein n=1 Tax=unclassified Clostridium TaxID=2614128 RepID=UPI001C0C9F07|nr:MULTISPECIES: phage holin family protein [unclassified Clostridium]MBU3091050.1 phage holin family protein [Clostridium sp. CF011]MBW9144969.1 phage holin family protein [Clostridium sp. CM027]UVE40106.1 phage holin family protein [Clostridium sp. CM027]WAG69031.1 phage holin family protein [Clostridium sp. CF011]
MDKNNIFLKIYGISGILGILSKIFTSIQTSYTILLVLISLDTITGIYTAIKYKRFSSVGLRKFTKKVSTYTLSIITVKLLENIIVPIVNTSMLSQTVIAFLAITESISILENLTLVGVPIPSNFLPLLIKTLKIPGLNNLLEDSKHNKEESSAIDDIDDIVNYQIPTFEDKYMRMFLEIKYDVWKSIINQIMLINETIQDNPDILFCKILSLVELGINDTNKRWVEEKIPIKYIEKISQEHQSKIDKCIEKLKIICYSEKTTGEKKDQIIDCILIALYQTIIDARKMI